MKKGKNVSENGPVHDLEKNLSKSTNKRNELNFRKDKSADREEIEELDSRFVFNISAQSNGIFDKISIFWKSLSKFKKFWLKVVGGYLTYVGVGGKDFIGDSIYWVVEKISGNLLKDEVAVC